MSTPNKVTPVGQYLRKLRIERGEVLYDMAQKLGITSAYLSAIELGKRNIPADFLGKLSERYELSREAQHELGTLIDRAADHIRIPMTNKLDDSARDTIIAFARALEKRPKEDINTMLKTLEKSIKEQEHPNGI